MQKEIYCGVRMEHIKKEVKDLESEKQVSNAEQSVWDAKYCLFWGLLILVINTKPIKVYL